MPPARRPYRKRKPKRKTTYRKKANAPRRMPYKSSRGKVVPYAYNVEILQRDLLPQTTNMRDNDASALIPKNTSIHMPCMFNANDEELQQVVTGNWITPKWLKSKFRVSFDKIVPDHADSAKGFNLWMIQGVVKTTGEKSFAVTDTYANWTQDILNTVGSQLVNSDFSSDYLDFTKKNRNIRIIQKKLIKGNRNGTLRQAILPASGQGQGENYTAPSPVCFSVNHALPNFKQRVLNNTTLTYLVMNQTYIPFVAFYCDELTANTGTFTIEQSSRFYYSDM